MNTISFKKLLNITVSQVYWFMPYDILIFKNPGLTTLKTLKWQKEKDLLRVDLCLISAQMEILVRVVL